MCNRRACFDCQANSFLLVLHSSQWYDGQKDFCNLNHILVEFWHHLLSAKESFAELLSLLSLRFQMATHTFDHCVWLHTTSNCSFSTCFHVLLLCCQRVRVFRPGGFAVLTHEQHPCLMGAEKGLAASLEGKRKYRHAWQQQYKHTS